MDEKILVNVMLPATRKSYDLWVPPTISVHDACDMIASILESRESDRFAATSSCALMMKDTGDLLDPNRLVGNVGLVNGTCLVLV